jgi:flavin reductase (DIM6/NTAB) family NADH-FMN oxidoreductase RutF
MANVRDTGVFCVNIVGQDMAGAMNTSAGNFPAEVSEFDTAYLIREECKQIACARVAGTPAALECKMTQIVEIEGENNFVCFGTVVGIHLNDKFLVDGKFDVTKFKPLARMGYKDYSVVSEQFELARPKT